MGMASNRTRIAKRNTPQHDSSEERPDDAAQKHDQGQAGEKELGFIDPQEENEDGRNDEPETGPGRLDRGVAKNLALVPEQEPAKGATRKPWEKSGFVYQSVLTCQ